MTTKAKLGLAVMAVLAASPALAAAPKCVSNADWLVVEKDHAGAVGSSYIVRDNKVTPKPPCSTRPLKGDRVIGGADDPYSLLKLAGSYIMIDSGTGPDRTLLIYDLRDGKAIFERGYDDSDFKVDATGAMFWAAIPDKPTSKNCPDLATIKKNDLTPTLFAFARFDLAAGTVTISKEIRCQATQ